MKTDIISNEEKQASVETLIERINAEPGLGSLMYSIIVFCMDAKTTGEVLNFIEDESEGTYLMKEPLVVLTWLIDAGGLSTIESQNEERMWVSTPVGVEASLFHLSDNRLAKLLDETPDFKEIFLHVLDMCQQPKTRDEIEDVVDKMLDESEADVFPNYFVGALEDAGGLAWKGMWVITKEGKDLLKFMAS